MPTITPFPSPPADSASNAVGSKNKFGVSWQVVSTVLGKMLQDKD